MCVRGVISWEGATSPLSRVVEIVDIYIKMQVTQTYSFFSMNGAVQLRFVPFTLCRWFQYTSHMDAMVAFPGGSDGKESACSVGDLGSIPGLGRFPGGGHGNPLQYSCLENPHGQRSLVGYSPWGCKESDMTEWLSTQHMEAIESPGFHIRFIRHFSWNYQIIG